jgi:hypothetical protein
MAVTPKLCVLTVHGIGFQQPPLHDVPGYADVLHQNLAADLGHLLGNDPNREPAVSGPVYVMSARPGTRETEWGLKRLGQWRRDGRLDISDAPLAEDDRPIAHVALVYTSLEDVAPLLGSGTGTVAQAGLLLGQYASVGGAIRMVVGDASASLHEHGTPSPSLRPRSDLVPTHPFSIWRFLHPDLAANQPGGGLIATIMALEDDVVAYVCRNDLRESIRAFIREALRRLLAREDVLGVVVNAHSQGTVASFDVLQQYPQEQAARIRALVTAGSPLRKYADLFSWGRDAGSAASAGRWLNFWDEKDPVADPLDQPASWHCGNAVVDRGGQGLGLFWRVCADGTQAPVDIADHKVDNLSHSSGGGLQAHNYWDNTAEFVPELAASLKQELAVE